MPQTETIKWFEYPEYQPPMRFGYYLVSKGRKYRPLIAFWHVDSLWHDEKEHPIDGIVMWAELPKGIR